VDAKPLAFGATQRAQARLFSSCLRAARAIGIERASSFGERIGRAIGSWSSKNQNIERNLRLAFPDRDDAWIAATASSIWGQVGRSVAEYPHLAEIGKTGAGSRVEVVDHAEVASLRKGGRGIVFVSAHLGNWSIPAAIGNLHGFPLSVLYRRHKNACLEAVIEHWRNQIRAGFIDADVAASRAMMALLKNGACIGLHIDRRTPFDEDLPFFGIPAPTSTIPARLALKTGAAYVPARVERLPDVRFRITLYEPVAIEPATANLRAAARRMTSEANRRIEDWIRERPGQWICTSSRWPRLLQGAGPERLEIDQAASADAGVCSPS
jgi:KDO2-lipid IV(A) lauroyltransferase